MRVLHISTVGETGGAARAALNLHNGLKSLGCDSRMLVRDRRSEQVGIVPAIADDPQLALRDDQASLIQRKLVNPARSPVSNTWFSLPEPGWDISNHPEVLRADVLHLHWVSGFISPASIALLQRTGRPLVWTLHDQRPFTGGCHFSAGCRRFEKDCDTCPQLAGEPMFYLARAGLAESRRQVDPARVTVICPSAWMAHCARSSALFSKSRIEVIPYGVETESFRPQSGSINGRLERPEQGIVLLAGAGDAGEIRKGFDLFFDALRLCSGHEGFQREASAGRIRVVLFGLGVVPKNLPLPVQSLGRIESQQDLARVYGAADALVVPSIEDNLPNTMIEALCCGTPVIGYNIGGIPDAVSHGQNGRLMEEISAVALARELQSFCLSSTRGSFDRAQIAAAAAARYDLKRQAQSCLALYEELKAQGHAATGEDRGRVVGRAAASGDYEKEFSMLLSAAKRAQWNGRWQKLGRRMGLERMISRSTS